MLIALLTLSPSLAPAQAAEVDEPETAVSQAPIIIDSERGETDLRTGITRVQENVSIQRGAMFVEADTGEVIRRDGRISVVELTGNPVKWQDRLEDGSEVRGESQKIHFDVIENVVTLTGNARLVHERGEFNGDELVYDLDTENLVGRASEGNRVRVIIEPENGESDPGSTEIDGSDGEPEGEDAGSDTDNGGAAVG